MDAECEYVFRNRGYLPHLDSPDLIQHVILRLVDSIPPDLIRKYESELLIARKGTSASRNNAHMKHFQDKLDECLDKGYGQCILADHRSAEIVNGVIKHFDGSRYRLDAWAIMPNHVHAIIKMLPKCPLWKTINSWKSFSAKKINALTGRKGSVWALDYFDRYIRDHDHYFNAITYIHNNPVKAGLVQNPGDWEYSSYGRWHG